MSIHFIKVALRDYRVGAFTRSSKYVAKKILAEIFPASQRVVEYGPGDGVLTTAVLNSLTASGRLIVIESNPDFVKDLQKITDQRLTVISGLVQEVKIESPVDAVFSGIPFSFLSSADRTKIVQQTYDILNPGGVFVVYQYSLLMVPSLKQIFPQVTWKFELRNFPPYFIMVAKK